MRDPAHGHRRQALHLIAQLSRRAQSPFHKRDRLCFTRDAVKDHCVPAVRAKDRENFGKGGRHAKAIADGDADQVEDRHFLTLPLRYGSELLLQCGDFVRGIGQKSDLLRNLRQSARPDGR